ncbi:MAG: DUF2231 domain-containing protein [bacterium]
MPNVHPLLVHLPIALLTFSFFFDLVGVVSGRPNIVKVGWWTMVVGVLGAAAAVISGLIAEKTVSISASATEHFQTHQQMAFLVAGIYAALILWRTANRGEIPTKLKWAFLGIAAIGVAALWTGAWYGGEMVYRFGVGVQQ